MYHFGKGVCFYLTRLSLTSPSIRNWTSSPQRSRHFVSSKRERVRREQFSKFVYPQLMGEMHPAWNLIESDSVF